MDQSHTPTLLIIARWFPPDANAGCFRSLRFCRDLPAMGYRCKVITPAERCCTNRNTDSLNAIPAETEVIRFRCGNLAEHMERIVDNPAIGRFATFCAKATRRILKELRSPDIHAWSLGRLFRAVRRALEQHAIDAVLITGPPFSWMTLVAKIKAVRDVPVILDFRDPWTSNIAIYCSRREGVQRWSRRKEHAILRAADAVILNTEGAMQYYAETYGDLDQSRWVVIPNGFVKEQVDAVDPESFDRTTLVYGGVGRQDMMCVLAEAMAKLKAAGKITPASFRFISYGNEPATVTDVANRLDVGEMIEFRGYRSHDTVLASLKGAAGQLLLVDGACSWQVPGKVYEYISSGRPTLMIGPRDSDAARVLQRTGAGMVVDMTVDAITEGLDAILTGQLAVNINSEAVMAYESKSLSQKLVDLLDKVVKA